MTTKFENDSNVTYEVFTNVNGVKEFLYATDSLEDLKEFMQQKNVEQKEE